MGSPSSSETGDLADFEAQVSEFADELKSVLVSVLGPCGRIETTFSGDRALVELLPEDSAETARGVVVNAAGRDAARLLVRIGLRSDSSGRFLAVTFSSVALYALPDREPLFRLDYRDDMATAPSCHWQVHAERGALSHLLTIGERDQPHMLSALHLPVGGSRMRPCIEDFLQFAIEECGIDAVDGYAQLLDEGRERWRRRQLGAFVRDVPEEAVRVLRMLGYSVVAGTPAASAAVA